MPISYLDSYPRHISDTKYFPTLSNNMLEVKSFYHSELSLIYVEGIDTVPPNAVNCAVDSAVKINSISSLKLNNGYIPTKYFNFSSNFNFATWLHFGIDNTITVLDCTSQTSVTFSITINKNLKKLTLSRLMSLENANLQEIEVDLTSVDLNTWIFIQIIRYKSNLYVYVNNVKLYQDFYYFKVFPGVVTVGGSGSKFNFSHFILNYSIFPDELEKEVINRDSLIEKTVSIENSQLHKNTLMSNTSLIPNSLFKFPDGSILNTISVSNTYLKDGVYTVRPRNHLTDFSESSYTKGLLLFLKHHVHPNNYFWEAKIAINNTINIINQYVVLVSTYDSMNNGYYIRYNFILRKIEFVFKNADTNILTNLVVSDVLTTLSAVVGVHIKTLTGNLKRITIYIDGIKFTTYDIPLKLPLLAVFKFNYNENNTININSLFLYSFYVLENITVADTYRPLAYLFPESLLDRNPLLYVDKNIELGQHRQLTNVYDVEPNLNFEVYITRTINQGTSLVGYIKQQNISTTDNQYYVSIKAELLGNPEIEGITVLPVNLIIKKDKQYGKFTVSLSEASVYYKTYKLTVSNEYVTKTIRLNTFSNASSDINLLTTIQGHVVSFLSKFQGDRMLSTDELYYLDADPDSVITNSIYGEAIYLSPLVYGNSSPLYIKDVSSDQVESFDNIRTIFFIYKENLPTVNRRYVGHTDTYTFNGGENYELVGDIDLDPLEFTKIDTIAGIVIASGISANSATYAYIKEDLAVLHVRQKEIDGNWSEDIVIPLGILDSQIANVNLTVNNTGTFILVNLPDYLEGNVKGYRYDENTSEWDLELDLSSPVTLENSFGTYSVCDNAANTLYVAQGSTQTVYIYSRTLGVWNPIPIGSIVFGVNILGLAVNSNNTVLAINSTSNTVIYRYTSSWTVSQTLTGTNLKINPDFSKCVIKDSGVKVYTHTGVTFNLLTTFSNASPDFGEVLDISNNGNVCVNNPVNGQILLYTFVTSAYVAPVNLTTECYLVNMSEDTILLSDVNTVLDVYSNDNTLLNIPILLARQNYLVSSNSDILDGDNIQVLCFVTNSGISIDQVGSAKSGFDVNTPVGYFKGMVLFNRVLSVTEISEVETHIDKYLNLRQYSLLDLEYNGNNADEIIDELDEILLDEEGNSVNV